MKFEYEGSDEALTQMNLRDAEGNFAQYLEFNSLKDLLQFVSEYNDIAVTIMPLNETFNVPRLVFEVVDEDRYPFDEKLLDVILD